MLTILPRGSEKWGCGWRVTQGKKRASVLFCVFVKGKMIKHVCVVLGMIRAGRKL